MNLNKKDILENLKSSPKKGLVYPNMEERKGIFSPAPNDLKTLFAKQFHQLGGHLFDCNNEADCMNQMQRILLENNWKNSLHCYHPYWQKLLAAKQIENSTTPQIDIQVGITTCQALVARTGSVLVAADGPAGRGLSIVPPIHIIIAYSKQLVYNLEQVLTQETASMLCITSGNSRTADIEKTLVNGAHGPKTLYLFLISNS